VTSISDLINTIVFVAIKDYDSDDNGIDFDSLGCVQFSFNDIVMNGKTTSRKINAIIDNGRTHPIQNDTNMTVKGTLGKIKINVSFIFEDDATNLFRAYPAFDRHNKQVASFEAFYYNLMSKIDPSKDLGNTFKRSRSISPDATRSGMMTSRSGLLTARTRGSSKSTTTLKVGRARSLSPGPRRSSSNDSLFGNMTALNENNVLSVIEEGSREVGDGADESILQAVNEELQASQQAIQNAKSARDRMDGKKTSTKSKKLETIVDSPLKESDKENDINQSQKMNRVTSEVSADTVPMEIAPKVFCLDVILTDVVIYGIGALLNAPKMATTEENKEVEGVVSPSAVESSESPDEAAISANEEVLVKESTTDLLSWKVDILDTSSGDGSLPLLTWESAARYFPPTTPDEVQWNGLDEVRRVTSEDALKSFDFSNSSLTPTLEMSFQILKHAPDQESDKEVFAVAKFQLPCLRTAKSAKITDSLKFKFTDESIDPSVLKNTYLGFSWVHIQSDETVVAVDNKREESSPPFVMDVPTGGDEMSPPGDNEEFAPQQEEYNVQTSSASSLFVLRCKKTKTDYKCIFPGSTRIGREAIEDESTGEVWFPHWCPRDEKGAPLSKNYILRKHAELIIEGSIDNPQIKLRNHSKGGCSIYNDPKNPSTAIRVSLIEDSLINATLPGENNIQIGEYIQFCPGNYLFQLLQLTDEGKLLPKVVDPFFGFGGDLYECDVHEYNEKLSATYPSPIKKLTKSDVPSLGINAMIPTATNKSSSLLRSSSANKKNRGGKSSIERDDSSDALVASGGNVKTVKALQQLTQQRKELEKILKEIKVKSNKYDKRLMALERKIGLDGSSIFSGSTPGSVGHDVAVSIATDKRSEARAKEQEVGNDVSGSQPYPSSGALDRGNEFMPPGGGDEALPGDDDHDGHSPRNYPQNQSGSGIAGNHFTEKQWGQLEAMIKKGHLTNAFTKVLDHGDFMDLSKLMTLCNGPQPENLSITVRNKLYGRISTMLNNGKEVERNLVWILALVRQNLVGEMVRHTVYDVRTALLHTASEPSKRGMLAALLEDAIKQHQRALYGGKS